MSLNLDRVGSQHCTHQSLEGVRLDPAEALIKELFSDILSYLKSSSLNACCLVSKKWKQLASSDELWRVVISREIAFGKQQWATYFGDVGVEPPLSQNIYQILKSSCPFWEKKVGQTHMLVLIPKTINGKPLSLKSLGELVQAPKQGNATKYSHFNLGEYTDPPAPASHWVLMTRDVLPGSRNKSYDKQQAMVKSYAEKTKTPYQVPPILDATVCIFMEYVLSGTRLYSDNPWTYTRCQAKYGRDRQLVVGGFASGGLLVNPDFDVNYDGVAALRKL
jgi:NLR family CARD domain-containing protein 3